MNRLTVPEILKFTWTQQADYLRGLSRKELEVLWFQLQRQGEALDRLQLAVFSILRDLYENRDRGRRSRKGSFDLPKRWDEFKKIATGRNLACLAGLSLLELNLLMAVLNRLRIPEPELDEFSRFYLEVADRIRAQTI